MAELPLNPVVYGIAIVMKKINPSDFAKLIQSYRDEKKPLTIRCLRDDGCAHSFEWDALPLHGGGWHRIGTPRKPVQLDEKDEWYAPEWVVALYFDRGPGNEPFYVLPRRDDEIEIPEEKV